MLVTNRQSAELPEPRIGSLHNPAAEIAPQFASILARGGASGRAACLFDALVSEARVLSTALLIRQQLLPILHGRSSPAHLPHG